MKTSKGFIVPLLIVIIAALAIGGAVYIYKTNKQVPIMVQATNRDDVNIAHNSVGSSTKSQAATLPTTQIKSNIATTKSNTTPSENINKVSQPVPNTAPRISGWKIYSDTTHGFTIQYPPNWILVSDPTKLNSTYHEVLSLKDPGDKLGQDFLEVFWGYNYQYYISNIFGSGFSQTYPTLDSWINGGISKTMVQSIGTMTVAGVKGYKVFLGDNELTYATFASIVERNEPTHKDVYELRFPELNYPKDYKSFTPIENQILSTFGFIN